jgi:hypothetical protein
MGNGKGLTVVLFFAMKGGHGDYVSSLPRNVGLREIPREARRAPLFQVREDF